MNFYIKKLILNFKNYDPEIYEFKGNRVNVITGDSGTGKTSILSIIDYCLLSTKVNIPYEIQAKVEWFSIEFSINNKDWYIARKSPKDGLSGDIFFNEEGFPQSLYSNYNINELKQRLDLEFGIDENLLYPLGREYGASSLEVSFRDFLIFNALTENIIGAQEKYFDTDFFNISEADERFRKIFLLAIGVNSIEKIKALDDILNIKDKIAKIDKDLQGFERSTTIYNNKINEIVSKCNNIGLDIDANIDSIANLVNEVNSFNYDDHLTELEALESRHEEIVFEINSIKKYRKQYSEYKNSLLKHKDSLVPVEFLRGSLNDQLIQSDDVLRFIDVLEKSLKNVKSGIEKFNSLEFLEYGGFDILKEEEAEIRLKIIEMKKLKEKMLKISTKIFTIGEISILYQKLSKYRKRDSADLAEKENLIEKLNELNELADNKSVEIAINDSLNSHIQENFDKIDSMPYYADYNLEFDIDLMKLQLFPEEDQLKLPVDNVGSKSNYMFLHLCFYLGLHQHFIASGQKFVPSFIFIDQPSIPYFKGDSISNSDDKKKLIDAFSLLDKFIYYVNKEFKVNFQIVLIEHAPEDYWVKNGLKNFYLVADFFDGNALIPEGIFNGDVKNELV